jgi:hypothetical protein
LADRHAKAIPASPLGSPRLRFWVGSAGTVAMMLFCSTALLRHMPSPGPLSCGSVAWIAGLAWVLSAHARQAGGWRRLPLARAIWVAAGFSVAVFLCFAVVLGVLAFGRLSS